MNETVSYFQVFAALLFVLGLIAFMAWILRRFASGNGFTLKLGVKPEKRLVVAESLWLDARYRVVIVREGTHEHTLLLGPQGAVPLHHAPNASGLTDAK